MPCASSQMESEVSMWATTTATWLICLILGMGSSLFRIPEFDGLFGGIVQHQNQFIIQLAILMGPKSLAAHGSVGLVDVGGAEGIWQILAEYLLYPVFDRPDLLPENGLIRHGIILLFG